jgi:ABC-type phosphate/phosphonate transport system substrate-binding protein
MRFLHRASMAVLALATLVLSVVLPAGAQDKTGKLRFGVGPLQATPTETKKAYEPFFAYVAKKLNREFDLVKEFLEGLERTLDACEDVGGALRTVVIKNA